MMGKLAVGAAAVVALPVLAMVGLGVGQATGPIDWASAATGLSPVAVAAYRQAADGAATAWGCTIPASLIAAIGAVESNHGTIGGSNLDQDGWVEPEIIGPRLDGSGVGGNTTPVYDTDHGVLDGDDTYDAAVGPMQFLPATWHRYEAAVDGTRFPQNLYDAAPAAAWYLCAGTSRDLTNPAVMAAAILTYNRSGAYLTQVLAEQAVLEPLLDGTLGAATHLLDHPRFGTDARGHADLTAGTVDPRLVGLLWTIVTDLELTIWATPFQTGHSRCVGGDAGKTDSTCSESHHYHGRGIDISFVAGEPVRAHNPAARRITDWLATLAMVDELSISVGSPWPDYVEPGFFTDNGHANHIHLAVCGPRLRYGTTWSDCR